MPDLDLDPHEYAERDPSTGRLKREMSPRWFAGWMCVGLVMLGWAWWNRDAISTDALFGFVVVVSIPTGMCLFGMLKDIY